MSSDEPKNPFRISGVVVGNQFADREEEVARILQAMREPGSKLLVRGVRRMGKTSAIAKAIEWHRLGDKGRVGTVDLSTVGSVADLADLILREVSEQLVGENRRESWLATVAKSITVGISVKVDPVTGLPMPRVDFSLRSQPLKEQQAVLTEVLNAAEELAKESEVPCALVLDEFQEILRFDGKEGFNEWNLRGIIQHHEKLSYVLAGSKRHLIDRMLESDRGFYRMLDKLNMGPIERDYLVPWLVERLSPLGGEIEAAAVRVVELAGERTHDRMRLARLVWFRGKQAGKLGEELADEAFEALVEEDVDEFLRHWDGLTFIQQNTLRAVSMSEESLSAEATMRSYSLKNSSSVTQAAKVLLEKDLLVQAGKGKPYSFDNPFFGEWVRQRTVSDLGL
ncbi:MAG: AAA family ATPase [Verrucomicrobiota bacterium]